MECRVLVNGVSKRFGDIEAVREVSFEAGPGIHVFLGPNGSGKSTLLGMIAGAVRPSSGRIEICGIDIWGSRGLEARRLIGYAPQEPPFRRLLTGLENLVYHGMLRGLSKSEAVRRAWRLLDEVGLGDDALRIVGKYSGGMLRRLTLAAALIGNPEVLVLDEPSTGLDPGARRMLWRILERLRGEGKIVLMATHYAEEAEKLGDTVYIMHRGIVKAWGGPGELVARYGGPSTIMIEPLRDLREAAKPVEDMGVDFEIDEDEGVVRIRVNSPEKTAPRLIEKLLSSGIRIRSLSIKEPGLEEVYFNVTGERLEGTEPG